jgi:hypothetical protein
VVSIVGWFARSPRVDAITALVGATLTVFLVRWLWLLRSDYNLLTGFWLTIAAGVLVFLFGVASVLFSAS